MEFQTLSNKRKAKKGVGPRRKLEEAQVDGVALRINIQVYIFLKSMQEL